MPRGRNQEISALGEFPLCKTDKRVSLWSRLDERGQTARGSNQTGKKCRGRGRRRANKTRVWMRLEEGRGPAQSWGHQERTASKDVPPRRAVWEPTPLRKFGTLHPEYTARIKDQKPRA